MAQVGDLPGKSASSGGVVALASGKLCSVQISHTHFQVEFPLLPLVGAGPFRRL